MRQEGLKIKSYLSSKECMKLANTKKFYDAKEVFGNAGYYDVRLAKSIYEIINILKKSGPKNNGFGFLGIIFEPISWLILAIFSCS